MLGCLDALRIGGRIGRIGRIRKIGCIGRIARIRRIAGIDGIGSKSMGIKTTIFSNLFFQLIVPTNFFRGLGMLVGAMGRSQMLPGQILN